MMLTLRRKASIYGAFAAMMPKLFLAYAGWVWMELFVQLISIIILYFFWQGIYANSSSIGGLSLQQTLNYVILARIFGGSFQAFVISHIGRLIGDGSISIELLRPVDFQLGHYVAMLAQMGIDIITKLPLLMIGLLFFNLQLPTDPFVWLSFVASVLLGHAALFCFDWAFACLAFYSTEVWGLSVLRGGIGAFFSGEMIPLKILPPGLQAIAFTLPFAQGVYIPLSILNGITPLSDVPRALFTQLLWLVGLAIFSRLVFKYAVRKVTVQGG